MTDNEIIKAMECCINNDWNKTKCNQCSFYTGYLGCVDELKKSTIDLINRQKEEIESLTKTLDIYAMEYSQAKSEAVKEFANEVEYFVMNEDIEVVEHKCKDYVSYINGANQFRHQIKNGINTIVKETTDNAEVETPPSDKSDTSPTGAALGKWLINPDGYYPYCSECKTEPEGRKMTKFCPECGADMRGKESESE